MTIPFSLEARVESGKGLGRLLGAPTVNLRLPENIAPPEYGVYAVRALVGGREYPAVADIGVRPTVENEGRAACEVHIFDFSGDLYGEKVKIIFEKYLRPEKRFESREELRSAIELDVKRAREYFAGTVRRNNGNEE